MFWVFVAVARTASHTAVVEQFQAAVDVGLGTRMPWSGDFNLGEVIPRIAVAHH